jgi:SPP1 gp7 family putative phage head morphogenesis protein
MRNLTKDSNPFKIRDKIVKAYLKMILRRFKRLNQGFITGFDEINILSAVNTAYEDVINMSVEALKKIAKQTYRWVCDDDFEADLWLSGFLQLYDPVTHYKWYDEADRKRSRAYEAIMSCRTSAERKKQIEVALKAWAKQFEQTADDVVVAVVKKAYEDNGIKYVKWVTKKDKRVCPDCNKRNGKIYPITSPDLQPLHYNCRCWWMPIFKR